MRWTSLALAAPVMAAATACSGGGGLTHDVPWTLVLADRNSAVAVVLYFHGDCDSLRSVHTISSSTTVTFKITVHEDARACDAAGRGNIIRIRLGAKLGDRKVMGACRPRPGILCEPRPPQTSFDASKLPIYGP